MFQIVLALMGTKEIHSKHVDFLLLLHHLHQGQRLLTLVNHPLADLMRNVETLMTMLLVTAYQLTSDHLHSADQNVQLTVTVL